MLDVLQSHQVVVTAFLVGTFVDQNPDVVARIVSDGHEIANHTYTHLTFPSLSPTDMQVEVTKCRDSLQRVAGTAGQLFRPSGTANGTDPPASTVLDLAGNAGYHRVVGFDVDPADYQDPGASVIAQRTAAMLQPGSIVSLHFGHQGTIDALPAILATLDRRGLRPVSVTQLLTG